MIDIDALKRDKRPQSSTIVHALIDRLEAAESDALEQARLNGMGSEREAALMAKLEAAERERDECNRRRLEAADHFAAQTALMKKKYDALRAKIAEMEQQEPIARTVRGVSEWVSNGDGTYSLGGCLEAVAPLPDDAQLYALPGAQPAPSFADAYQGAMEEVAIWKKRALEAEGLNRKFVAEINGPTYMGEPAQPAPSMPEVTDAMALAFHHALTDGSIGAREVEEIKDALRAALAAAPKLEGE